MTTHEIKLFLPFSLVFHIVYWLPTFVNKLKVWSGRNGCKKKPADKEEKEEHPFILALVVSVHDRRALCFRIIPPQTTKIWSNWLNGGNIYPDPYLSFSFHITAFSTSLPVCCGRDSPFVRAVGTRVLPGYKPTNGVLTVAALLHCRRAETNRIQSLKCAHLRFLSVLSVCALQERKGVT